MSDADLSEAQSRRSRQFAEAQTNAMTVYCEAEHDLKVMQAENAKLREQMERLVTLLRVDCDIEASWDGLRKFWSIGLTEDGCLMRDRACKAEAENTKLRNLIDGFMFCDSTNSASSDDCIGCPLHDQSPHNYRCTKDERMRELGVTDA